MKPQIIFILSTNYAGSHLLALQLGSHSHCQSLGEFHRYGRKPEKLSRAACAICPSDAACPVFSGVYGADSGDLFERIFSNLAVFAPAVNTVVDNSKKWMWAERFLALPGYDLRFLHLVRDPRALIRRWQINGRQAGGEFKVRWRTARRLWPKAPEILFGSQANVYIHKWVMQNRQITDFIARHQLPHKLITYRELVLFPNRVLGEVMAWLGHEYEPEQRHYWNFVHHCSQKAEYMKSPQGGKLHDQRWRDDLTPAVQERVASHPQVRRYLASQSIELINDGLVLHPEWLQDLVVPSA